MIRRILSSLSFLMGAGVSPFSCGITLIVAGILFTSALSSPAQSVAFAGAQVTVPASGLNGDRGVAIDASGNLYIADTLNKQVLKLTRTALGGYTQSVVANNANNGIAEPTSVAVDASGNVYVADPNNGQVLKETPSGAGYAQTVVGTGATAQAVAVDANYNVYIAFYNQGTIWQVPCGTCNSPSGSYGTAVELVLANSVTLNGPLALAVDAVGNLYVADSVNNRVLQLQPVGGGNTYYPVTVADATNNGINNPLGVAVDAKGNVFISDANNRVLKETNLGAKGYSQSVFPTRDGTKPFGIGFDASGDLFIADPWASQVLEQMPTANIGPVNVGASSPAPVSIFFSLIAGATVGSTAVSSESMTEPEFTNAGSGNCAAKTYPTSQICSIDVRFAPSLAGTRYGIAALKDGSGNTLASGAIEGTGVGPQLSFLPASQSTVTSMSQHMFVAPAVDGRGNVYVLDSTPPETLYKETLSGGSYSQSTVASGFLQPAGVAVDGSGNVYVADLGDLNEGGSTHGTVYLETLQPDGSYVSSTIGSGFVMPSGVAVDGQGNVYVADNGEAYPAQLSGGLYKEILQSNGTYSQVQLGVEQGSGYTYSGDFTGVAVDGSGNLYVIPIYAQTNGVLKMTPAKPSPSMPAYLYTETAIGSGWTMPVGVAVDGNGNLYVSDSGVITRETPQLDGSYTQTTVATPSSGGFQKVAVDTLGNLYPVYITSVDSQGSWTTGVYKYDFVDPPSVAFPQTAEGSTSPAQAVTVTNVGNASLSFSSIAFPPQFPESSADKGDCSISTPLAAAAACTLTIDFVPNATGPQAGSLTLTDNALNIPGITQTISLSGSGTAAPAAQTINFTKIASPVIFGVAPITLSATATSTLTVTFSVVSGPGSVNGNMLTITGVGSVVVAADQAGNGGYFAAPEVKQTIVVNKASQTITFNKFTSPVTYSGTRIALTATASSKLAVTYSVTGPATILGATLTLTGAGSVNVTANQAGNANYLAAPPVPQPLTVSKAALPLRFSATSTNFQYGTSQKFTATLSAVTGITPPSGSVTFLNGTASMGTGPLNSSGVATMAAGSLPVGTYSIKASYPGDTNYLAAATSTATSIQVTKDTQTITFPTLPANEPYSASPITLKATTNCGLKVAYAATGPATVNGASLAFTALGTVKVTASQQSGSANCAAASPVSLSFHVVKGDTKVTLTTSATTAPAGKPITFTATLAAAATSPTGKVTFMVGPAPVGTATLASGKATFTTSDFALGVDTVAAIYGGDTLYNGASSNTINLTITTADYGAVAVGSSQTLSIPVTITNSGTLKSISVLTQGASGLDFTQAAGGSCTVGTDYIQNANCTVNVTFKPAHPGEIHGAIILNDDDVSLAISYLAGKGTGAQAVYPPGTQPKLVGGFPSAFGVTVDGGGNVFVADWIDHAVYKETLSGGTYTQSTIGTGWSTPQGLAVDGAGILYVCDSKKAALYQETLLNGVYTQTQIAGGFGHPMGIAVDGAGNIYVADTTGVVWKETLLLSGGGYTQSKIDSGFPNPIGVAVDAAGNVFVLDAGYTTNDGAIYRETLANSAYTRTTIASGLDVPEGIAIDGNGNLYVANLGNSTVTVMSLQPNGAYVDSTLGGGWSLPTTVAVDGKGGVYVTDTAAQDEVQKVDLSVPPSLSFASTVKGSTSKDSPQTVPVLNLGNAQLKFSAVSFPADFPEAAKATGDCKSTTQLAAGASCTLTVDFTPVAALGSSKSQVLNENVTLTTNTLNVAATRQKIAVTGTETAP